MRDKETITGIQRPEAVETVTPPPARPWRHRWFGMLKETFIRASHWEYWPVYVFYAPVIPYWLWLSLRARTLFFFSAANPGMPNAGFTLAKKTEIYRLIPAAYYPKTLLYSAGIASDALRQSLDENKLHFPLMAKPDIGDRGVQVKLLHTVSDLEAYCRSSKVDFLIQEFVDYEHEAGVFYYRFPGEAHGHISGIVHKSYLTVTGDGVSSMEQLLQKEDRYFIQLPRLRTTYGARLDEVLPKGLRYTLPYGSHCRGAKFTDASHQADHALGQTMDELFGQISGFHYGRMDVKFKSWDDLRAGTNFSIIELNGAASEPAHIYDPAHSVFFAWKEVCRHWRLLYQISKANAVRSGLNLMRMSEGLRMMKTHFRNLKLMR